MNLSFISIGLTILCAVLLFWYIRKETSNVHNKIHAVYQYITKEQQLQQQQQEENTKEEIKHVSLQQQPQQDLIEVSEGEETDLDDENNVLDTDEEMTTDDEEENDDEDTKKVDLNITNMTYEVQQSIPVEIKQLDHHTTQDVSTVEQIKKEDDTNEGHTMPKNISELRKLNVNTLKKLAIPFVDDPIKMKKKELIELLEPHISSSQNKKDDEDTIVSIN